MRAIVLSAALAAVYLPMWAQGPSDVNPDEIIQKFAAKEKEFSDARNNYTYRQTVKMEELDPDGSPTNRKWELVEDVIFTPEGKRTEKVIYAPVQTLSLMLTQEDEQDLRSVQPFVLTTAEIPEYDIKYQGRDKIDEVGTYKFSVKPKKMVKGRRYFEGDIWVDDRDLQIVKTFGKGEGLVNKDTNQFPRFETYREQIDGKYWFPTYTHADDTLRFKSSSQRIRMTVRYQDYKHYEGKSTIRYGEVVDDKKTTPPPAIKKQ